MRSVYKNKIEFDNEKRVVRIDTPLEETLYFKYDAQGRITEINNDKSYIGIYEYINSSSNKMKRFTDTDGIEITYAYEGDELYSVVVLSQEYNNQLILLNDDALIPIKGKDSNNTETLRVIDNLGLIVDYCDTFNRDKSDVYGIKARKYEINKVDDETFEISYDKKKH